MNVIKIAGVLAIATLLLVSTVWMQDAASASELPKNLVDRLRDAGRSLKESLAKSGSTTRQDAGSAVVAGAVAEVQPSQAQQKALEAYAASQSVNGVFVEVERSVIADLDGDGNPEVVAEINSYMGNSHFGRLVVFVEAGNGLRKVAQSEEPLGQVEGIGVADGLIQVESRWLGPNDARCCPSLEKTTHYRWQGDTVTEVARGEAARAATK